MLCNRGKNKLWKVAIKQKCRGFANFMDVPRPINWLMPRFSYETTIITLKQYV